MQRNIITAHDVQVLSARSPQQAGKERTEGVDAAKAEVPSVDSWYQRLAKAIPAEALSLYLGLDRAMQGDVGDPQTKYWLGGALLISLAFNVAFLLKVWHVRMSQVGVSTLALVAYAYAMGGVFAEVGWTNPRAQLFVLIATAAVLSLFTPPEKEPPAA